MGHSWYCAEVEPNRSHFMIKDLVKAGFTAFYPTCLERRFRARTRSHENIIRPLFPGYAFVSCGGEQVHQEILKARGVLGLIRGAGSELPCPVNPRAMERLLALAAAGPLKDDRWMLAFAPGQRVKVLEGAWQGFEGPVDRCVKERVWVLMSLFGRVSPVEMQAGALEAA